MITLYACLTAFAVPASFALYYRVQAGAARDAANLARATLTGVEAQHDFAVRELIESAGFGGFDVKRFEIMEESLVSVPSNTDSYTQEIILGLVEGGKLTSPMMKSIGSEIRSKRSIRVPVTVDLNLRING